MEKNAAAVSSPEDEIAVLEKEIVEFKQQREAVMQQIRELRASESRELGQHNASDIFMLQQEKLRLDAEVDFREKRISRIGYLNDNAAC